MNSERHNSRSPSYASASTPWELPFDHTDLAPLDGHIGPEPEDFVVDEVPLYAASGQGDHWYVRLRKRAATTQELRAAVASAAGVAEVDVGYAGMKDKHAVTTQWLSVPVPRSRPPEAWELPECFTLLEVGRHSNKLRLGHLERNLFRIRLVDVGEDGAERIVPLLERIAAEGLGNYFGSQRFGTGQRNLDSALFGLRRGRLGPRASQRSRFLASVIQSEVFNRYAMRRLELGRTRVLAGDVVRLESSRAVFTVDDVAREQPRLEQRAIHLTGPMIGPKMKEAAGQPRELEFAAAESLGLDLQQLQALGRWAPGTRRDLVLWPTHLHHEARADGSLVVEFSLAAGAYASLVIRSLTRRDPWLGTRREDTTEDNGDIQVSE